jgi:PGF-pre-PGF domain-containing protein
MIFTVNEPLGTVGTGYSYAIISITLVPSGTLGSTDLIVTDAGSTSHVPDGRTVAGIVAISPVAVNPSAISSGTITFAVSGAWLSAHGLTPTNIVLMRFHDGVWAELPTTYQYQSGNAYYFTATTPGFSYFAITSRAAGTTAVNASAAVTTLPESIARTTSVLSSSDSRQATDQKSGVPVAQQTTAAPAGAQTPAGSPGFPLATIALIGAGCVVLVGGGWYARRWWIQRQNPALFKKYD